MGWNLPSLCQDLGERTRQAEREHIVLYSVAVRELRQEYTAGPFRSTAEALQIQKYQSQKSRCAVLAHASAWSSLQPKIIQYIISDVQVIHW